MSIVTRTGDKGETGLFGGSRVHKSDIRIHAYGSVDELNAMLGIALASGGLTDALRQQLLRTQNVLFRLGADLAAPPAMDGASVQRMHQEHIDEVEKWIEALEERLPVLRHFILPGGSGGGALLHGARTVCRRAERWTAALHAQGLASDICLRYLNRLSDYLFLAAMQANADADTPDTAVTYE